MAPSRGAEEALERSREPPDPRRCACGLEAIGCWALLPARRGFPGALEARATRRGRLIGRGDPGPPAADRRPVTIVGTRRAGAYGREVADELGRELGAAGVAVVSGMALGIDAAAHRGALDGGGVTRRGPAARPDAPTAQRRRSIERIVERGAGDLRAAAGDGPAP